MSSHTCRYEYSTGRAPAHWAHGPLPIGPGSGPGPGPRAHAHWAHGPLPIGPGSGPGPGPGPWALAHWARGPWPIGVSGGPKMPLLRSNARVITHIHTSPWFALEYFFIFCLFLGVLRFRLACLLTCLLAPASRQTLEASRASKERSLCHFGSFYMDYVFTLDSIAAWNGCPSILVPFACSKNDGDNACISHSFQSEVCWAIVQFQSAVSRLGSGSDDLGFTFMTLAALLVSI